MVIRSHTTIMHVALTRIPEVITKETFQLLFPMLDARGWMVTHGGFANGNTHHGRNVIQFHTLWFGARDLRLHRCVNVARYVLTHMHRSAASFDARPLRNVASGKMILRIGSFREQV